MKPIRTILTTLLITGVASFGYARPATPVAAPMFSAMSSGFAVGSTPQQQDEEKPKDEQDSKSSDSGKQQTKPAKQQAPDARKPVTPAKQQTQTQPQQDRNQRQNQNLAKQGQKEDTSRGGHGRIADKDYTAHFGQEHKFNVRQVVTTTTIVPNRTRFVYTGYTFVFAEPWPAGWALDDQCYIVFIDGAYYLLDPAHPGVQLELTIVG